MDVLNIFEVCFILDKQNWNLNYDKFRYEFKCADNNNEYVKEVLKNLKDSLGIMMKEEIDEVLNNPEKFKEVCKQTVHCDNKEKDTSKKIFLGRCMIEYAREENPNFLI